MTHETYRIDDRIMEFYSHGEEQDRLNQGAFRLERTRTLHLLAKALPMPPAVVLDVGGAAGAYSFPLREKGYEVHLIDPVPLHIEQAKDYATAKDQQLASYTVGDARALLWNDGSVDIVLLFGPLYHLLDENDRLLALREAYRVLKNGGILLATAISRYASLMDGLYRGYLTDPVFCAKVDQDLNNGCHQSKDHKYFTTAFFHKPEELRHEVEQAGFVDVSIKAIEGPVWDNPSVEQLIHDKSAWNSLLAFLERIEEEKSILGASAHLMAHAAKK